MTTPPEPTAPDGPAPTADARSVSIALTTAPDAACAADLARALVESGLAACVQVVPGVRSLYRWKGAVQDDAELLLIVKTRTDRVDALAAAIRERHPYETPEFLSFPAERASQAYLSWLMD